MKYLFIIFVVFFTACSNTNTVTEYYPNGKVKFTGDKKEGHKTGTWNYFDESGKLRLKELYKTDTLLSKVEYTNDGYLEFDYKNREVVNTQSYTIINGDSLLKFTATKDSSIINEFDSNHVLNYTRIQYLGRLSLDSKEYSFEKGLMMSSTMQREVKDSIVEATRCIYVPEKKCSSYFYDHKTRKIISVLP